MECAQCHDHFFDDRITQDDFWGFAAHFAQISRPEGRMMTTSPVLRVHDADFGEVRIPDSEEIVAPKLPEYVLTNVSFQKAERSRREQLAEWLTHSQNRQFARATVNRLWQQLFGRGLVEPVDDMRPDNPAVCPEVLDLLADDFAASGFDLRKLIRALVLSDAYQLSSAAENDDDTQSHAFARMNLKAFTADQLYDCIAVATRNESNLVANPDGRGENAVARTGNQTRQQFIELFKAVGDSRTDYQAGIPQALTLMHGSVVHGATDLAGSGLLKSLQAPFFSNEQRLETVYLSLLCREPTDKERSLLLEYVEQGSAETNTADESDESESNATVSEEGQRLGDVVWALLNSSEFVFIH